MDGKHHCNRHTHAHGHAQRDTQAHTHRNTHTDAHADTQAYTGTHTGRQAHRQTDRHTRRHTRRHALTHRRTTPTQTDEKSPRPTDSVATAIGRGWRASVQLSVDTCRTHQGSLPPPLPLPLQQQQRREMVTPANCFVTNKGSLTNNLTVSERCWTRRWTRVRGMAGHLSRASGGGGGGGGGVLIHPFLRQQ